VNSRPATVSRGRHARAQALAHTILVGFVVEVEPATKTLDEDLAAVIEAVREGIR
jgi:hypothetical protein